MAKSKSFFGLRKGSTKTMTYSVLKGQQITKDRVVDIANPRTMDQTLQRIPFAQAVKFYKQATRGLFRFAFEDKKPLESDYNAFMRHNVKYASSVSIDNYRNNNYPSLGNYLLSSGSLPEAKWTHAGSQIEVYIGEASSNISSIGGLSTLILAGYPNLAEGDIVTIVFVNTSVLSTGLMAGQNPPTFTVKQFVINENDTTALSTLGIDNIAEEENSFLVSGLDYLHASAAAVIFSRNSQSGLKVSNAELRGNNIWTTILEGKANLQAKEGDAYSWGAAEKAILEGSIAEQERV